MNKTIISEEDFSIFESVGHICVYTEKTRIYMENEKSQYFYIIKKGRIRVYISSSYGKEFTLDVLKKGSFFGDNSFLVDAYHQVDIEAVTEVEIIQCEIGKVIDILFKNKALMVLILQYLTETTDYLTHQIRVLTMYNSTQRIADFLIRITNHGHKTIPYTHEHIASCLNLNRVTVSRILKQFQDHGWIESSYGLIKVYEPDSLLLLLETIET